MAIESGIQLPNEGLGKILRTEQVNIAGTDKEQQVITLADADGNLVALTANRLHVNALVANGSDVSQGAIADALYSDTTGAASGSVIALLKGLLVILAGILTFKRALGSTTASSGSLTTSSTTVKAANANRKSILVKNNSSVIIYLNFGATAATNTDASLAIDPGDSYYDELSSSAITGRSASGTASITVVEVA